MDRFWSKVDIKGDDECWEWKNGKSQGYGIFRYDGRAQKSSRVAYILTHGPIAKDLHVCHSCDNPPCCNPKHLWLGTNQDNISDKMEKNRQPRKYNLEMIEAIKNSEGTCAEIGKKFNCSSRTVWVYKYKNGLW